MEGNGAWSSTTTTALVPVPRAFANLRAALDLAPSLVEVEQALNSMELHLRRAPLAAAIELGSDAPSSPRRPRQRRTFDLTAVRRSARLAKKPVFTAEVRAQRNLLHKLGVPVEELAPIEEVLQEFIAMFRGPLPEHIMAAMTAIFNLDDDDADMLDDALIQHAGTAWADLVLVDDASLA
ncbi:hypothetical protein PVAP13_3KG437701 [Panicum virgatum]|uniref:Uncharacterized protein n=1 Tax=Panicum virgatum TaxID=38727 RepID=A0A8T0V1W5_PANVG|nr:hypothetical protein PVAP13_3KG437701 [Panicum virgatum]